jgi:hypothetical protein
MQKLTATNLQVIEHPTGFQLFSATGIMNIKVFPDAE